MKILANFSRKGSLMSEKRRFHVVPQLLLVEDFAAVAALIAFFPLTNKTPSAVSSQYAQ